MCCLLYTIYARVRAHETRIVTRCIHVFSYNVKINIVIINIGNLANW